MRAVVPPQLPAELPADGPAVPAWAYRSEAFAEDFDDATLPGLPSPRRLLVQDGKPALWPWALGVPALVLVIGLVAALHG